MPIIDPHLRDRPLPQICPFCLNFCPISGISHIYNSPGPNLDVESGIRTRRNRNGKLPLLFGILLSLATAQRSLAKLDSPHKFAGEDAKQKAVG